MDENKEQKSFSKKCHESQKNRSLYFFDNTTKLYVYTTFLLEKIKVQTSLRTIYEEIESEIKTLENEMNYTAPEHVSSRLILK